MRPACAVPSSDLDGLPNEIKLAVASYFDRAQDLARAEEVLWPRARDPRTDQWEGCPKIWAQQVKVFAPRVSMPHFPLSPPRPRAAAPQSHCSTQQCSSPEAMQARPAGSNPDHVWVELQVRSKQTHRRPSVFNAGADFEQLVRWHRRDPSVIARALQFLTVFAPHSPLFLQCERIERDENLRRLYGTQFAPHRHLRGANLYIRPNPQTGDPVPLFADPLDALPAYTAALPSHEGAPPARRGRNLPLAYRPAPSQRRIVVGLPPPEDDVSE
jgi:hypothetical protein